MFTLTQQVIHRHIKSPRDFHGHLNWDSLAAYGINKSRLQCVGLGNNFMLNYEETAEEAALNRRVEVRILSK